MNTDPTARPVDRPHAPAAPAPASRPARRLPIFGALLTLALVFSAGAQSLQQGTTNLRLDAVDVTGAANGKFVFFASLLDKNFEAIKVTDPTKWTASFNGEVTDGEKSVTRLGDSEYGVSVVFVFAAIEALDFAFFDASRQGLSNTLNALRNTDRSAVVAYANTVEKTGGLTPGHNDAVDWIAERKQGGLQAFMFDALKQGLNFFPQDHGSIGPNRVLILVTDGFDDSDQKPDVARELLESVKSMAKNRRVRIDVVGITLENPDDLDRVKKLAHATGGAYREARTPADVQKFLGHARDSLLDQHVFTLESMAFEDNRETSFKVTVEHGGRDYTSDPVDEVLPKKVSRWGFYLAWAGGGLLGLGLLFLSFKLIGRLMRSRRERDEYVEEGPELAKCGGCSNMIPLDWQVCKYCEALPHLGRLTVRSAGALNGRVFFIRDALTNIGSASGNSVVINDASVSKRHAGIKVQDSRFELADYGSTNGVLVNGQRITKQFLRAGDKLSIGMVELEFQLKS